MTRVRIIWQEAGKPYDHMAPAYARRDNQGFGVRFYPYDIPLIKLQVIDGRVLNTKTKEDIGSYDKVKRVITIRDELHPLSTTAKRKEK